MSNTQDAECPQCGRDLQPVRQSKNSLLNADAVKRGDWFCDACEHNGVSPRYFWNRDLIAAPGAESAAPDASKVAEFSYLAGYEDGRKAAALPAAPAAQPEQAAAERVTRARLDECADILSRIVARYPLGDLAAEASRVLSRLRGVQAAQPDAPAVPAGPLRYSRCGSVAGQAQRRDSQVVDCLECGNVWRTVLADPGTVAEFALAVPAGQEAVFAALRVQGAIGPAGRWRPDMLVIPLDDLNAAFRVAARHAAAPAAPAVPAGWKLVPAVPTDEMLHAGRASGAGAGWSCAYDAMFKAAPAAPAVAVPPMLLPDAVIDEIDCAQGWHPGNARKVSLRLYARAIEAERDKQWIASCGVRS